VKRYLRIISIFLVFGFVLGVSIVSAELVLDPESSAVRLKVKASPPHTFTCDLMAYDAQVDIDPVSGVFRSVRFSFQLSDLETHNKSRNKKMLKWMGEDFDTIIWTMTSVEETEGGYLAKGTLLMHGESRPVDVLFHMSVDDGVYNITGSADFDYRDFQLPIIKLLIFKVNPQLHVDFQLKGAISKSK